MVIKYIGVGVEFWFADTEIGHTHGYPLDIANRIFNYCSFDLKGKFGEFSLKTAKTVSRKPKGPAKR